MTPEIEDRLKKASPEKRRRAIHDARDAGATVREIADAIGLSVGGVHRILKEEQP